MLMSLFVARFLLPPDSTSTPAIRTSRTAPLKNLDSDEKLNRRVQLRDLEATEVPGDAIGPP